MFQKNKTNRLQEWPNLMELIKSYKEEESSICPTSGLEIKASKDPSIDELKTPRFTQEQIESLMRLESDSKEILVTKVFAILMFHGQLKTETLKEIKIADLTRTEEGYQVSCQVLMT